MHTYPFINLLYIRVSFKGYSKKDRNGTTPYHVVDHGFGMLSGVSSATQAIGQ